LVFWNGKLNSSLRRIAMRRAVLLGAIASVSIGCAPTLKKKELAGVAKDWCQTIRASQVIPVYPLTEDLQPGDVFLVQTPIPRQEELYETRGFLPLDQMVTRLHDLNYTSFYRSAYYRGDFAGTPHSRPVPAKISGASATSGGETESGASSAGDEAQARRFAGAALPMAAFPSYSFEVDSSAGLRIAVPVHGIPLGLGLMQTDRAVGTITISDGLTYGIDAENALGRLRVWGDRPQVRQELSDIARLVPEELYLRVVTRVYFAGAVDVLLQNARAGGAGLDAGQAQAINLPDLSGSDPAQVKKAAEAYGEALKALSGALTSAAPGGSVRLTFASQRSIGLSEQFPRPLAVGYLGFDVLVNEDGTLGPPVATQDVLDPSQAIRPVAPSVQTDVVVTYLRTIHSDLGDLADDARANQLAGQLNLVAPRLLADNGKVPPTEFDWSAKTRTLTHRTPPQVQLPANPDFGSVLAQWTRNRNYVRALKAALNTPADQLKLADADSAPISASKKDIEWLKDTLSRYQADLAAFEHELRHHPDIVKAVQHHNARFVEQP
jgi:hypothetical protein